MRKSFKSYRSGLRATTALTAIIAGAAVLGAGSAFALDYHVTDTATLAAAIASANASPESDRIILDNDITLDTYLPPLGDSSDDVLAIDLNGKTISGNNQTRVFFANAGEADIENGNIANGVAQGGAGGDGNDGAGGGGMGAGGALYVRNGATVGLVGVNFQDNTARGGAGGNNIGTISSGGGGGGGLGGDGGDAVATSGGSGGGGGAFGNGGSPPNPGNPNLPVPGGGGGGPAGGAGGGPGNTGGAGGDLSGGGGSGSVSTFPPFNMAVGGAGGYGGGGGGSADIEGIGGAGGYGGGGGGSGTYTGGKGGFGGGGGGGVVGGGSTFGGGQGGVSNGAGGGGGAGFGGAIFVEDGGNLLYTGSSTMSGGAVQGGAGGGSGGIALGGGGMARGTGIFLQNERVGFASGAGQTQTINDIIADDSGNGGNKGSLLKGGAGRLILGGANTYAGGTKILDGVVEISSDGNLGDPTGGVTFESGTAYNPNDGTGANATLNTTQTFSSARDFTFSNYGGRIDTKTGTTLTLSGILSGGGSFIKQGTGALVLTGNSSGYAGTTVVTQGTLRLENGAKLGSVAGYISGTGGETGNMVVTGTGTTWTSLGQIRVGDAGSGTLLIEAGGKVSSVNDGIIATNGGTSGKVTITGVGSEWASAGSTLYVGGSGSGALTVANGGTMKVGGGSGKIQVGYFSGAAGGTVNIGAAEGDAAAAVGTLQASEIALTATAGQLVFNHTNMGYVFSPTISGAGSVRQLSGVTILSGVNSYTGGTSLVGGVLQISQDSNLGAAAGGLAFTNGTLKTTGTFTSARNITLASAAGIDVATGTQLDLTGIISNSGSLNKTGAGTLRLTGANSYAGGTTVSAGTLIGDATSLKGNILNNASLVFDQSGAGTYSGGTISGLGTLTKKGTGALILTGANTYLGGTTITDGVVAVSSDGNLGDPGGLVTLVSATSDANATLRATNSFVSARNFAFDNFGGRIDTDTGMTLTLAGELSGGGGANFVKQGLGTLALTGNSVAFSGTTKVTAGELRIQGGGVLGNAGSSAGYISGTGGEVAHVVVTGAGSSWTSGGQIRVGDAGSGTLWIDAGGKVASKNDGIIGAEEGVMGAVAITGVGSEWASAGSILYVGAFGTGALTVANGGTMKVGGGTGKIQAGIDPDGLGGIINIGADESDAAAAAGTLQASEIALTASASRLVFNHTDTNYSFSQTISGVGSVKQVAGTTVLSGANSYKGGTTITGGVLSVASDGNLGDAAGPLSIGAGTLRATQGFASARAVTLTGAGTIEAQTDELELTGNLTGVGSLTKTGAGDLRLSGLSSYIGGTTVSAGKLIGDTDSLQGAILNNAALEFDQAALGTYAGVLSGTGTIAKQGTGTLFFTGVSSGFTGATSVEEGALRVNGTLGGTMTVKSGATLGGKGAVGKTTIEVGGVHAPGNSIDKQTIYGDYINKGTLEIEGTPSEADQVIVNGTVTLTNAILDLKLSPTSASSWEVLTGPYVIIDNDGSDAVIGSFGTVQKNLVFLDPTVRYDGGTGNDVTLELVRNNVDFTEIAGTRNQRATAGGINTLDNSSAVWRALAVSTDAAAAQALLDELSGEVHASLAGMLNEDSRFWRNAANERLRAAFDRVGASGQNAMGFGALGLENAPADSKGLVLWQQSFGSWRTTDSDGNAAQFKRSTGGVLGGADMPVGDVARLGLLGGYGYSSFDADDRDSSGTANSFALGLYGGVELDAVALRAGIAYAWHDIETRRHAMGERLDADYDAGTVQAFGELGYAIDLGALRFEPFVNAAYVSTRTDDFHEKGGAAALESDAETNEDTFTTLGLRAGIAFDLGDMPGAFRAMAGWRHAYGDVTPDATFAFEGSQDFVIAGAPIARDAAVIEAGFDLSLSNDATLGIAYSGEIGDDAEDHGVNATLGVEF